MHYSTHCTRRQTIIGGGLSRRGSVRFKRLTFHSQGPHSRRLTPLVALAEQVEWLERWRGRLAEDFSPSPLRPLVLSPARSGSSPCRATMPAETWHRFELRIPNAAAQTRIVSGGQFWPSRREVRCSDARREMAARECRRALQKWSRGAMRSMDWDDYLRQQAAMYRLAIPRLSES